MVNPETETETALGPAAKDHPVSGEPNGETAWARRKASVLVEALPWMRRFAGEVFVIKYGGNAMVSDQLRQALAHDIIFLHHVGIRVVVVHGGGPQINEMLRRLGMEPEFRGGFRYTDAETMDVVRMVLTGKVQRELVSLLNADHPYSIGLSGEDAQLFMARRARTDGAGKAADLGHVGELVGVNPAAIEGVLENGRIAVVSSIGVDVDSTTEVLNINADLAAADLAAALGARKLIMVTDVEGVYRNWPDKNSLITSMRAGELRELLPALSSGMIPKMEAALQALSGGVPEVHVIDGRLEHSMLVEVFTDEGIGTAIYPDE